MKSDNGFAGGGGAGGVPPLLRTFAKGADLTIGGIITLRFVSYATITFVKLQGQYALASKNNNQAKLYSCSLCKAKGFYMCKLCKGNATIQWSPLYDPVAINPCLCPTCDGHRKWVRMQGCQLDAEKEELKEWNWYQIYTTPRPLPFLA